MRVQRAGGGQVRGLVFGMIAALCATLVAPAAPIRADSGVETDVVEITGAVDASRTFDLSMPASHVALHWPGARDAELTVAFSSEGASFTSPQPVEIDEVGMAREDGRTYGAVMVAGGATAVRVTSDRPLPEVEVVVLDTRADAAGALGIGARAAAATAQPAVITRAGWGANEHLRFDENGEIWTREYFPIQKLVVHHTAMGDNDPDPAATVRAIYYYHAVTQEWGDIGYNFLIDSAGRVYEGRYSREYAPGVSPTGDNADRHGVEAGHARAYNAGSVGIALLGTFETRQPSAAAQAALVRTLAWASARYSLDPRGASVYVNPINGETRHTPNIAGHRDYNPTACPGAALYPMLPEFRRLVANELVERLSGGDRYATAAAIAGAWHAARPESKPVTHAFVATGHNFPDALAGAAAAGALDAPILLTQRDALPAGTVHQLQRIAPSRIVVLGGEGAVSDAVLQQLASMAPGGAERVSGSDRYSTAAAISEAFFPDGAPAAFLVTGRNFPDALAAAPAAATLGAPILLTTPEALSLAAADEIRRLAPQRIFVIGGNAVVSDHVVTQANALAPGGAMRISGADRYATAAAVAATFFPSAHAAYVATGRNFPDALAGAAPAGSQRAPILLAGSGPGGLPVPISDQLGRLAPARIWVLGGTVAVPESTVTWIREILRMR